MSRSTTTTFLPLAAGGLLSVGTGLSLFGDAVTRKISADRPGKAAVSGTGWFWRGTLSLVLVNAGICLVIEASKRRG